MERLLLLVLLLLQLAPSFSTSTVEFFSSKSCVNSLGEVNGTTDGVCHQAIANNNGARVIELDAGCAATIYTDPYCSDSATIAQLNICMSGSLIVGSFSIDCQNTQSSAAAFTATGPTATGSPVAANAASPATSTPTTGPSNSASTEVAPIAAAIAAALVLVSLLPIGYFARRHYLKKRAAKKELESIRRKDISGPTELAAVEKLEMEHDEKAMSFPQVVVPSSPPPNVPMVSPLTPLPSTAHGRQGQQRLTPGWPAPGGGINRTGSQWRSYHDKNLPALPGPQRPGSYAELATAEPVLQRTASIASNTSAGSNLGASYSSTHPLHDKNSF